MVKMEKHLWSAKRMWEYIKRMQSKNVMMVVFKTQIQSVMMYDDEYWPLKKRQVEKLHATDMRMLMWAGGVTMFKDIQKQQNPELLMETSGNY